MLQARAFNLIRLPQRHTSVHVGTSYWLRSCSVTTKKKVLPSFMCLGEGDTVQVFDGGCRGSCKECRAGTDGFSDYTTVRRQSSRVSLKRETSHYFLTYPSG